MAKHQPQQPADNGDARRLSAFDRVIQAAMGEDRKVGREDDPARQQYPELWRWLSQTSGGHDYIIQPAVISIQLGPEGVLATVTHRDFKTSCPAACAHLEEVFAALEAALTSPISPMRTWGKDPQVRLKKRKPKS